MENEFNPILFQKTLQQLKDEVQLLKEQIQNNASKEDIYVFRLEGYCNELKEAFVDFTLKLPNQSSFEYYLSKLDNRKNIEYILGLLHYCWILVHPMKLYDRIYKENPMEMLDCVLCKFTGDEKHKPGGDYDLVASEIDSGCNRFLSDHHFSNTQNLKNGKLLYGFQEYLYKLYFSIKPICERNNIIIRKEFTVDSSLATGLSRSQISAVFDAVSQKGYISNDSETRSNFLSMFDTTCHIRNDKIMWKDVNKKNKQPAIASLYIMFQTMGIEMNAVNRETICQYFNDANNEPISPDSLKSRSLSGNLEDIDRIVREAISQ